jgi:PGF-CTERM protein
VTLPEGGFVTVYNSSGGLVGTSAYLEAGTHENVTVSISPALSRSQVVVAQAHRNNGTESFNATEDTAYTNDNGQAVADTAYVATEEFTRTTATATETATATATETAAATESDGGDATGTESATETSGPGFTALAALVALVGAALLARR